MNIQKITEKTVALNRKRVNYTIYFLQSVRLKGTGGFIFAGLHTKLNSVHVPETP